MTNDQNRNQGPQASGQQDQQKTGQQSDRQQRQGGQQGGLAGSDDQGDQSGSQGSKRAASKKKNNSGKQSARGPALFPTGGSQWRPTNLRVMATQWSRSEAYTTEGEEHWSSGQFVAQKKGAAKFSQADGSQGPLWHQNYSLDRLHNQTRFWQHLLANDCGWAHDYAPFGQTERFSPRRQHAVYCSRGYRDGRDRRRHPDPRTCRGRLLPRPIAGQSAQISERLLTCLFTVTSA
jgi:hypothetical protein